MFGGYLISTDRFISTGNMLDLGKGVFPVYREPTTNPDNPQYSFLSDPQDNFAWAVFANLGYQFSDLLRIDASLRYDHDQRKNTTETPDAWLGYINYIASLYGAPQSAQGDVRTRNFSAWQPKVTVTLTPTDRPDVLRRLFARLPLGRVQPDRRRRGRRSATASSA